MWPDLIQKAKDGGLDVIQTYVFWNGHEPSPGKVAQNRKIMAFSFFFFFSCIHMYIMNEKRGILNNLSQCCCFVDCCSIILRGTMIW